LSWWFKRESECNIADAAAWLNGASDKLPHHTVKISVRLCCPPLNCIFTPGRSPSFCTADTDYFTFYDVHTAADWRPSSPQSPRETTSLTHITKSEHKEISIVASYILASAKA